MSEYDVRGPFRIPFVTLPGGKKLEWEKFWDDPHTKIVKKDRGVYVYTIKPSKSKVHIPFYVGQAKRTFEQEVFQPRNLQKYDNALKTYQKAHPCMFFVIHPRKRGKTNEREVTEIEKYLIREGKIVNPDITNETHIKLPTWQIKGFGTSTKKQSASEKEFHNMFFGKQK